MEIKDIILFRNRFRCGDIIIVENPAEAGHELTKASIVQIYPKYAIVSNGKYKWCQHWIDLIRMN